ncbi:MAG: S-layer homology domain-containing protein [Clostridiales bacterium]|nr:S-layer homology domain-containing protein [Clostridiales bacterium]
MNKRIQAGIAAAIMAFTVAAVPFTAGLPAFAAGQTQSDENNTEFARSIINSGAGTPDRFLDRKYPEKAELLISYTSKITAGAKDTYEAALKLYDWMVYNIDYKWGTFGPESISYIFEKNQGTCTDFSYTFMAWLRYNGIKAWCATGSYYYGSYRWDHTWCVAEFGGVEYIFDPQIQNHTYVRTGEMSHSKFCRAAADVAENYVASSARYFNYDSGDTSQTSTSYRMQSGNAGSVNYDVPAPEKTVETPVQDTPPAAETSAQPIPGTFEILSDSDFDAPVMPEAANFDSGDAVPAAGSEPNAYFEILTEDDFGADDFVSAGEAGGYTESDIIGYEPEFSDVEDSYEYINGVKYVSLTGLMNGVEEGVFAPESEITRGMLVTVLGRLLKISADDYAGYTAFGDVDSDSWYAPYVSWAADCGFVLGYADGSFRPDAYVTREQFYVVMKRLLDSEGFEIVPGPASFADIDYLDSWAFDAVAACDGINLIPLRSDRLLMPVKTLDRGELADAILRFALYRGDIAR